jgi:hypothetical protein
MKTKKGRKQIRKPKTTLKFPSKNLLQFQKISLYYSYIKKKGVDMMQ